MVARFLLTVLFLLVPATVASEPLSKRRSLRRNRCGIPGI